MPSGSVWHNAADFIRTVIKAGCWNWSGAEPGLGGGVAELRAVGMATGMVELGYSTS